ncbi:two component transcriptional regulator, LytTR family [Aquimarina amphilecti]|uniref:Two component transcriptional regulator, LytTR family n=1 Tax=Aquimarina amphilecti TaxID=1038014 RepID=A0A1H7HP79_AQUAM|nr:LytTR family DNA-binding domain-containing protein [Aquimarina amphilecti]SEK50840.1 two component transcriptional regulator, LytTR family [Aquimarina amphilecti]
MHRCLIIDDEELARTLLKTYIDRLDYLEIVASLENPLEAINILKNESIDVIFLDIQMPELKGTDLAKIIPSTTQIIFTTAYSEYALEGFELNALDYLLKPITFDRFLAAIQKIKKEKLITSTEDKITVKSGYDLHKIKYSDVLYIESDSEYVIFHTNRKKIMSHQTLKSLEEKLPEMFMRVHRSFIINKNYVTALKGKDLFLTDIKIPVSSSYYDLVKNLLF